jgi:short-subunit dehydrogenase
VSRFTQRYGPAALVVGASEGIGAAFATEVARRGLRPILVARRPEPLAQLASRLAGMAITADIAEGVDAIIDATSAEEVGLVVCNAAFAPAGRFLERDVGDALRALDVNARALVSLAHAYLPAMVRRGRGGFVVMSSLAGLQGSPGLATYAATKAFGAVFAEGLWGELAGTGVDVVTCVAGAVSTPGLAKSKQGKAPGTVAPEVVVRSALAALGRRPRTVPGAMMRASAQVMGRLMPRATAIRLIGRASRDVT